MLIYVDKENKCHVSDDGTMVPVEISIFDGKCKSFIEGHYCILRDNGKMVAPWKNYDVLQAYQTQYEAMIAEQEDKQTALETLGVNVNG
jgi:hypothetical protein